MFVCVGLCNSRSFAWFVFFLLFFLVTAVTTAAAAVAAGGIARASFNPARSRLVYFIILMSESRAS